MATLLRFHPGSARHTFDMDMHRRWRGHFENHLRSHLFRCLRKRGRAQQRALGLCCGTGHWANKRCGMTTAVRQKNVKAAVTRRERR